jgi:hypothetical protein
MCLYDNAQLHNAVQGNNHCLFWEKLKNTLCGQNAELAVVVHTDTSQF